MSERVDIIVVTYNSAATIKQTLNVILDSVDAGLAKCVVIDNGSTDNTLPILEQYRSSIDVIKSTNLGFAAGCNIGIKATGSDYVLLHNPDSYMELLDLKILVDFMDNKTSASVVAPAILEGGQDWQMVGGRTTPRSILKEALGRADSGKREVRHKTPPFKTSWVCGALFMIRREVMNVTGLLDEIYFMYFEETDFCYQVEKHGGEIWSVGTAIGYHVGGGSSASSDDIINGCISRFYFPSRIHYISKIFGRFAAYFTFTAEIVVVMIKIALKLLLRFKLDRKSWLYARYLYRYYLLWN